MSTGIDENYEHILRRENSLAKAVALEVVKPKPIAVWEVIVPILLIFNHFRLKAAREVFAQNLLFTKKLALDGAMRMARDAQTRQKALSSIMDHTASILASDTQGIYSEQIRQRQIEEIGLLIDHYARLLSAEGMDYPSLVRNAYRGKKNYASFLKELKAAEEEVFFAAKKTLGARTVPGMISSMEQAAQRLRMAEIEGIFSESSPGC